MPTPNQGYPTIDPDDDVSTGPSPINVALNMIDASVTAILASLAIKAALVHGHNLSEVTGLVDALAAKMSASATFPLDWLNDVSTSGAANGNVLAKTPTGWSPANATDVLGTHQHEQGDIVGLVSALTALSNAISAEATTARNAANLSSGTVPLARLLTSGAIPYTDIIRDDTTDLDTLTSPGWQPHYYGETNAHLPKAGSWTILVLQQGDPNIVTQIAFPYPNTIEPFGIHIRGRFAEVWYAWEEFALKSFVAANYPGRPKNASGVGQWLAVNGASGAGYTLPAGGTWAYCVWRIDVATLAFASSIVAGANAGGVTPIAGVAGDAVRGFVWRVG